MALKYGRLPPHPRTTHPRVVLDAHTDWDTLLASVPAKVDRAGKVPSWPMYLNDQLGDCAEAGAGHAVQAITAQAGSLVTPMDAEIEYLYEQAAGYNPADPATDAGTNLQDLLTWWSKNQWCGVQLEAFAELRRWDARSMRACLWYFGTVYVGVNFPKGGMAQFEAGQPWHVIPGDVNDGGHCIVLEDVEPGNDTYTWITWGAKQRSNRAWWWTYAEEAWVIVTPQALAAPPPGVDTAGIMSAFKSLTR